MRVIDAHVPNIQFPIVRIAVLQATRIQSAERVVSEEQRSAVALPQGQLDAVILLAVHEVAAGGEPSVVHQGIDAIARRRRRQYIGDQALVPTVDLVIHRPTVVGTPVPVEDLAPTLGEPIPFHIFPEECDPPSQGILRRGLMREVLPCAEQAHAEKRGLHQICGVILAPEGDRRAGGPVHEMGERPVVARRADQHIEHAPQALDDGLSRNPAALGSDDEGHDGEAGSTDGNTVIHDVLTHRTTIEGHAADRMSAFPEVTKRLPLHGLDQRLVGEGRQAGWHAGRFGGGGARRRRPWLRRGALLAAAGVPAPGLGLKHPRRLLAWAPLDVSSRRL